MSFILGAKPDDHKYLFEMANLSANKRIINCTTADGYVH